MVKLIYSFVIICFCTLHVVSSFKVADLRNLYLELKDVPDEDYSMNYLTQGKSPQQKRGGYSLNDLLARLRVIAGQDEIYHNGKSTYVRFGAGGK